MLCLFFLILQVFCCVLMKFLCKNVCVFVSRVFHVFFLSIFLFVLFYFFVVGVACLFSNEIKKERV